jgi:long-chain acyl-CoA synthetase
VSSPSSDAVRPTLAEVDRALTAPGAPFEMQTIEIEGVPLRVYKNAPPHLRFLFEESRKWGDRTFITYEEERLTYEQHYHAVVRLARELVERYNVQKGDRVAIAMRNLPEWSVVFWAIVSIGAVAVPLNSWWVAKELNFALADCGAQVAVLDAERYSILTAHLPELKL